MLEADLVYFQAAVLFSTPAGERRIRVHTLVLPVSGNILEVYSGIDNQAMICMLSKMGTASADRRSSNC